MAQPGQFDFASCQGATLQLQRAHTLPAQTTQSATEYRPRASSLSRIEQSFRQRVSCGDLILTDQTLHQLATGPTAVNANAFAALVRARSNPDSLVGEANLATFTKTLSICERKYQPDPEQEAHFQDGARAEDDSPSPPRSPKGQGYRPKQLEVDSAEPVDLDQDGKICSVCCDSIPELPLVMLGCSCVTCTSIVRSKNHLHRPAVGPLHPNEQPCGCGFKMCHPCTAQYIENIVSEGRFSCPPIRCPGCGDIFRGKTWRRYVDDKVFDQYIQNARDVLSLRCYECDQTRTLYAPDQSAETCTKMKEAVLGKLESDLDRKRLLRASCRYGRGEITAEEYLERSSEIIGDQRVLMQVFYYMIPSQLMDIEQRVRLQLTFLRLFPKIISPCCRISMCFKCKIAGHHKGRTCKEVMQEIFEMHQDDDKCIQFCPACGVPTWKTEGCNEIVCLCGECWEWDGDEFWDNDEHGHDSNHDDADFFKGQEEFMPEFSTCDY